MWKFRIGGLYRRSLGVGKIRFVWYFGYFVLGRIFWRLSFELVVIFRVYEFWASFKG